MIKPGVISLEKINKLEELYFQSGGNMCFTKLMEIVYDIPVVNKKQEFSVNPPLILNTDILRFRNLLNDFFNLTKTINPIQDNLWEIINNPSNVDELVDLLIVDYDLGERLDKVALELGRLYLKLELLF